MLEAVNAADGTAVSTQLLPLFTNDWKTPSISTQAYRLCFFAEVPPMGTRVYMLRAAPSNPDDVVLMFTGASQIEGLPDWVKVTHGEHVSEVSNELVLLDIDPTTFKVLDSRNDD